MVFTCPQHCYNYYIEIEDVVLTVICLVVDGLGTKVNEEGITFYNNVIY
jgi:hypothetical protein